MTPTPNPSEWRVGTVTQIIPETPRIRSFAFRFDTPIHHDAGQHYEIRLTSEDGYQAARLYSAAMPCNGTACDLQLTIARIAAGEVSPYLFDAIQLGSQLEIRGPLGRYFVWTPAIERPILLIGGGTGIVPLRAIRLAHQQAASKHPIKLLYSVKTYEDMIYKYEFLPNQHTPPDDVIITFTKHAPDDWNGYTRRLDNTMVAEVTNDFEQSPVVYVCGSTPMVETVTSALVKLGVDPNDVHAERFGATA